MQYFNEYILSNGIILSCDKIRLNFVLDEFTFKHINKYFDKLSLYDSKYMYQLFESHSWFNYKYVLNFTYENSVVAVGLGFNGVKKQDYFNCFIEFNPNKSMVNNYVQPILDYIRSVTTELTLARFDFAIDIPVKRGFVYLEKDKRNYSKVYKIEQSANNIDNFTEYLGARNNNGFVKLYNKTVESKLDYDLTRLEITLDSFDFDNFSKECPKVYFMNNLGILENTMSPTDRVVLALLAHSDQPLTYLNMFSRDKKEKYKNILFKKVKLNITEHDFYWFCSKIRAIYC